MTEPQTLRGRTALVTGATGLIGREIARSLAAEGVSIVAHYCRPRKYVLSLCSGIHEMGIEAWPVQADFRKSGSAESLVEKAFRCAGKFDILINSASLFTENTALNLTAAELFSNIRVNAWAPFALGRAFSRIARKGAIVNLLDSRIAGGDPPHTGYIISKYTLAWLTRMMAREFAPGITVNAVAPGLVLASPDRRAWTKNLPLRKAATAADVAEAVVFLVKSRSMTGQVLWVDNGRHLRESGWLPKS